MDPGNRSVVVYFLEPHSGGPARYGVGRVYTEPGKVPSTAVQGVEIDFAEAFAALTP